MPRSNILLVVVDGLRASALGAYGNTTYPTPSLDRFAADSFLFDWCYSPSADLADIYRAFWQSSHPSRPITNNIGNTEINARLSLPRLLTERGYQTTLVTDDSQLVTYADVADFHECVQLASSAEVATMASRVNDTSQTELARIFTAVSDVVARPESSPKLVWAHARGMYGLWDAPLELQDLMLEEGDPPAVKSATPPDFKLRMGDDPEEAFRFSCAYAAQAIVLDDCWQSLIDSLTAIRGDDGWLVMLIGARGYSLGEHGRVGGVDSRLYTEQLHVPWLIRYPDVRGRLARCSNLVSHLDVAPTLLEWIDGSPNAEPSAFDGLSTLPLASISSSPWRDALLSASSRGNYAIRTSAWSLLADARDVTDSKNIDAESESPSPPSPELYVRPDDRWEANDIGKLCGEVVEDLQVAVTDALRQLSNDEPLPHTLLPSETGVVQI